MNTPTRVGVFAAGLAVAFAAAFGVGRAVDLGMPRADEAAHGADAHGQPDETAEGTYAHGGQGTSGAGPGGATSGTGGHDGHRADDAAAADALPGGLQVAQDGYRLVLDHATGAPGADRPLRFRVIGPDNEPLLGYTRTHDKDLHLIAVRRDLTGFQHVHPRLGTDGTWSTSLDLTPGAWRVFADFDPVGEVRPMTLGADLLVAGPLVAQPLPAPSTSDEVDGYTVTLDGTLTPGADSTLRLTITRGGREVTDLQPYLAAYGHLVALREGDLAYLHVHPDGRPGDGSTRPGPVIVFHTTAPSAGSYRLFLDFKHRDTVHTAEFTVTAGKEAPAHGHR